MLEILFIGSRGIVACSENKGPDLLIMICVFVFQYAKSQFSHDEAHFMIFKQITVILGCLKLQHHVYKPHQEITSLQGFRPGPTQMGLRLLEAGNFRLRKKRDGTFYEAETKGLIGCVAADLCLCFHICKRQVF